MKADITDPEYIAEVWRKNDKRNREATSYYLGYCEDVWHRRAYFMSKDGLYITFDRTRAFKYTSEAKLKQAVTGLGNYRIEKIIPEITVEHRQVEINPVLIDPEFLMTVKGDAES